MLAPHNKGILMKRKTAQRLMYDRHQIRADYIETFGRPTRMPDGFWQTLSEIFAVTTLIGVALGLILYAIFGPPHGLHH